MKRGEKGFTLIEILIVLAISGAIIWPVTMATITLMTNPQRSTEQNVVLQEVQNVSYWISRDVQMARTVTPSEPNGFPLILDIPIDTDENNDYRIDYLFDGNKIKREVYDSSETLISETFIADYINTDNTTFITLDPVTGFHKFIIKASRGSTTLTKSYGVSQRL